MFLSVCICLSRSPCFFILPAFWVGGGCVGGAWVVGDTLQWQSDVYQSGKTALTARRAAECWQYRRTHTHVYYTAGYPSCVHKQRLDMERTDASLL